MLEDSYSNKDTIHMKMYITMAPLYRSPWSNKLFFFTPVYYNYNYCKYLMQDCKTFHYSLKRITIHTIQDNITILF